MISPKPNVTNFNKGERKSNLSTINHNEHNSNIKDPTPKSKDQTKETYLDRYKTKKGNSIVAETDHNKEYYSKNSNQNKVRVKADRTNSDINQSVYGENEKKTKLQSSLINYDKKNEKNPRPIKKNNPINLVTPKVENMKSSMSILNYLKNSFEETKSFDGIIVLKFNSLKNKRNASSVKKSTKEKIIDVK